MQRIIRLIVLFSLMTTFASTTATASELISNGGFETGDTTGWILYPAFDGSVISVESHTGTFCLKMEAVDPIEQEFSPPVSTTGDLTFWGKASHLFAGPAYATLTYSDGTDESIMWGGGMISDITWTQFTVPVDNTKLASKVQFFTGETVPLYLDDVSLSGPGEVCGDIDGSGSVNSTDLRLLLDHVFVGTLITNECVGDVDGSGNINILDVRLLMNHIADNAGYPLNCTC